MAVVLPASTQPVQVVEAYRLLEQRKSNPQAQPPRTWSPSVFALLNYPEVLALMNADLTWTEQLGTSVIHQQAAVMDAVQSFRKKALDAGNLKSNDKQTVTAANEAIVIQPASPQVVYVPSYNPTTVVYESPPDYPYPYYWSAPYPYYYSPYAPYYTGAAYGVSVGFAIGWYEHDIYHGDVDIDEIDKDGRPAAHRGAARGERNRREPSDPRNRGRSKPSEPRKCLAAGSHGTRPCGHRYGKRSRRYGPLTRWRWCWCWCWRCGPRARPAVHGRRSGAVCRGVLRHGPGGRGQPLCGARIDQHGRAGGASAAVVAVAVAADAARRGKE